MKRFMKKSVAALTAITLAATPVIAFAEEAAPSVVFADELDKNVTHTMKMTISQQHNVASHGNAVRIMYFEN